MLLLEKESREYNIILKELNEVTNEIEDIKKTRYPQQFNSVYYRQEKINRDPEIQMLISIQEDLRKELSNATPPALPQKKVKNVDDFALENEAIIAQIISHSEKLEDFIKLLENKAKSDGIRLGNQRINKQVKLNYTYNGIILS